MTAWLSVSRCALCALLLAAVAALPAAAARQTVSETSPGFFDREAIAEARASQHAELMASRVDAGLAEPVRAMPSSEALASIANDRGPRRMVGTMVPVFATALGERGEFGGARVSRQGWDWTGTVESPGATALRIAFSDFYLPSGAELYIYTDDGQVVGPYTGRGPGGRGEFLSHTVFGSSLLLQVHYEGSDGALALARARLSITGVGHMTERFTFGALQSTPPAGEAFCGFNEPCVENAECSNIPGAIAPAQGAAAHILFQSGASLYICSGGLLADTDPGSQIPYFLTANHCISKNNEASSMEAFFQFTTNCNGSCYDPDGVVPSTLGSSIVAKQRATDFTLLQLSEPAPPGSTLLGWNATPIAFSDGAELFRVSHPSGAPQAYSEHVVDASAPTCGGWGRGDRIYSRDTYGATEGGSSGSVVLNSAGQVVGQLSGACGTNVNDVCDTTNNATVDGAFAQYFDRVAPFLDAGGGCTDSDGDGYCAAEDCDDFDADINPGAAENCADGLDNDCDGLIDSQDPECGTCLPRGASCSADDVCCSNKCKGPPSNKTCR